MVPNTRKWAKSHRMVVDMTIKCVMMTTLWMLLASAGASAQSAGLAPAARPQGDDLSNDFYKVIRTNNMTQLRALVATGADVNTKVSPT